MAVGMIEHPVPSSRNFIALVDGENLVFRYQEMLSNRKRHSNTEYIEDVFVWHQYMGVAMGWSLLRVNYYTSATGSEDRIAALEKQISGVAVPRSGEAPCQICPRVFKKPAKSQKTKIVDISIALDALRHSYHRDVEAIWLFSGDGDYLPLIKDIMRNGTQVWLGAFSSGLNPALPPSVDRFVDLDQWFFV